MCSIPYLFIGGIHTAVAWWVSGIPFDMIHGVSNLVLMLVLYKPLRRVLEHCVVKNRRKAQSVVIFMDLAYNKSVIMERKTPIISNNELD